MRISPRFQKSPSDCAFSACMPRRSDLPAGLLFHTAHCQKPIRLFRSIPGCRCIPVEGMRKVCEYLSSGATTEWKHYDQKNLTGCAMIACMEGSASDSEFLYCKLSESNRRFSKYPQIPVKALCGIRTGFRGSKDSSNQQDRLMVLLRPTRSPAPECLWPYCQ